ncbi:hypothetical protein BGX27_010797, partial [Mortierella sp. AM989]
HNLDSVFSEPPPTQRRHALHIPEIVAMIVFYLKSTEILTCRGVSHEWRQIFSPFLELHGIYQNHSTAYKALFENRLETLGPFVQSLKYVSPTQADLEKIKRTCPQLKSIGFYLRGRMLLDTQVMVKFFQAMTRLEKVEVYSRQDQLLTACLVCLASYQISPSGLSTTTPHQPPVESLKTLEIENAHWMALPSMEWSLLEAVLTRHSLLKNLTIREAHLREASETTNSRGNSLTQPISVGIIFGQHVQQRWGEMLNKLKGGRVNRIGSSADPLAGIENLCPVIFSHLETLVLDKIRISIELFVNILSRCPALVTLDLKLTGVEMPMQAWSQCLPYCPQLANITVNNLYGGLCMDITKVWVMSPSLRTFHITRSHGPDVYFSEYKPLNEINLSQALYPGTTLVSLELSINIPIASEGVRYVMSHCRSLKGLVLGLLYFSDWEQDNEYLAPFPEWSCSRSLKTLEIQTTYRRYDHRFDERIHLFMSRLEDLKVLEKLTLPAKLLSDLLESRNEVYAGFRDLLVRLDIQDERDYHQAAEQQQWRQSQKLGKYQGHVWARDGSGPINVIPQLPSVKDVFLSSPSGCKFALEVRHLHILMEALPGVKTIWTSQELYAIDCIPRFKCFYRRFQELYGPTGVKLNLGTRSEESV